MEVLHEAPALDSFVPLAEHQATTPASFHSGPPVLHYFSDQCKVIVLDDELQTAPALSSFVAKAANLAPANEEEPQDETNGPGPAQKSLVDVDIWVTSDKLLLFSKSQHIGISIPYPAISLHAIQTLPTPTLDEPQSQGLYMQLVPSMPSPDDDEPPDTVSVTIIPTASAPPIRTGLPRDADEAIECESMPEQTPIQALFTALSDCSNLHPDPDDDDEQEQGSRIMHAGLAMPGMSDGSLPPPMPGSRGWITAENMHEFLDEDGNFIMDDGEEEEDDPNEPADEHKDDLGPGAGSVRPRTDDDTADRGEETKWQRMS